MEKGYFFFKGGGRAKWSGGQEGDLGQELGFKIVFQTSDFFALKVFLPCHYALLLY